MAEDTPPATEVEAFLSRLGDADQEELERASSAVRSDRSAWEAAGGKVAQIVAGLGLDEQKAQFCERARVIVEGKAVQIQGEDRKFAIWAARGVIVSLLADGSAERTDLTIFNCGSYRRGVRSSLVLARKPLSRPGWYCIRRSRVLTSAVSWPMSCFTRLASDRFRTDQTGSTGFSSGA